MKTLDLIKKEFTKQAPSFNAYQNTDAKKRFSERAVAAMRLSGEEIVLEAAAGTCSFGRMIAPHVKEITESDATVAMLAEGKKKTKKQTFATQNTSYAKRRGCRLTIARSI